MCVKSRKEKIIKQSEWVQFVCKFNQTTTYGLNSLSDKGIIYNINLTWTKEKISELDLSYLVANVTCHQVTAKYIYGPNKNSCMMPCLGNSHTVCYHSLAVLYKLAKDKNKTISFFDKFKEAFNYSNLGGQLIKIKNDHNGIVWGVIK